MPVSISPVLVQEYPMAGIAIAMFIALFGWGSKYSGWADAAEKIQLALGVGFILIVLSGYKAKS